MNKLNKLLCAVALASTATYANASQIEINAGGVTGGFKVEFPGGVPTIVSTDGDAQTATDFSVIDPASIATASSTYFDADGNGIINAGDIFIDQESSVNVALSDLDGNGATSNSFGTTWDLNTDWMLWGIVVDDGAGGLAGGIAGGFLNVYYNDVTTGTTANTVGVNDGKQVLNIDVSGSSLTGINLALDGVVDYSFCAPGCDPFVTDFFNWETPQSIAGTDYTTWYDYWLAGLAENPIISLDVVADTRFEATNPVDSTPNDGLVVIDSLFTDPTYNTERSEFDGFLAAIGYGALDTSAGIATSVRGGEELDLSITQVQVSEPTTLALFGLSLIGFAGMARRKKS